MPKGPVSIARGSTGRKQAPKKGTADGWHKKTRPEPGGERRAMRRKGHGCVVRSRSMRRQR